MSSRQLRKLQQQRELEEQARLQVQEEESEEEVIATSKPKPSLFANLAALEDENEDEDDEEAAEKEAEDVSEHEAPRTARSKKPKKSKKKKKGKNKLKEKPAEEKTAGDDIDAALAELNLKKPTGDTECPTFTVDPGYERICALLGVNTQHLRVANEMRNLFGKTAGDNHEEPAGPRRGGNRRQRAQNQPVDLETALKGHHLPGKGLPEITLRRNIFIQGKEDWPKAPTGGLTMAIVDDQRGTDGTVEFKYEHNSQYQALQQAFQGFVEMGDPQNLIGLLQRNPYHISLLGQVSKIAKDQGDHSLSSDLLERGLFNFGRASMSLFGTKIVEGKARLDFTRPENREIWLIGYQYIKSLVMKGTYRTALEWAKLLLALSPEDDPYCMRFMIHHLALRAHEFNWVLDLFESELPHVWAEDRDEEGREKNSVNHFKPSLAFAAMQLREGRQSRKLLSESMQEVPWLFVRLFKELDLTAPPSIWGIEPRTDAETLFSEMYILQTKDLWNSPEATALLMEIAHTIPKVEIGLVPLVQNTEMNLDVVRFVYLDNKPELMRLVPSDLLHRRNNSDSDPLPPIVNIFSYESQRTAIDGPQQPQMGGDFFDPIAALARLLPGLRMPDANGNVNEEQNEELRREFEEEIANSGDLEVQNGPNGERAINMPMSLARRLMSMIWPGGAPPDLVDDEGNDEDENTDTDDETPQLTNQNEDEVDSEDEMPELIDQ